MQFPDSMGLQLSIVIASSLSVDHRCINSGFKHLLRGPRPVIKIRYADLPGGLHIRAVARGKDTIIYLLPGLTAEQRQAALRRARSSGRMGQGPRLSPAGVAGAVMVDRMRTTVRYGAAAMRGHPAIFVPPILIIVTAAVAYILLVSVSIRISEPQASEHGDPIPAAAAPPPGSRAQDPAPQPTRPPSLRLFYTPAPRRSGGGGHHPAGPSPSASPTPSPTGAQPAPSQTPSPSASPSPSPGGSGSAGSGSAGSGSAGSGSAGSGSAGSGSAGSGSAGGGVCLDIGLLGVCLST
jgi:uncharacterized membrane protein YgcG